MPKNPFDRFEFKVANYKCFGETPCGFDEVKPFNLIIGRNNSGKSALLDILEYLLTPNATSRQELLRRGGADPDRAAFTVTSPLPLEALKKEVARPRAELWADTRLKLKGAAGGTWIAVEMVGAPERLPGQNALTNVAARAGNPLQSMTFRRLSSDRDIVPEPETALSTPTIKANGEDATAVFQVVRGRRDFEEGLVEETVLEALRSICLPDADFYRLDVMQVSTGLGAVSIPVSQRLWEIQLYESEKGRVGLSQSGSGVKTVLLVLANLHLVPHVEDRKIKDYVFGFEELENNLHPAVQRRLFTYLRQFVKQTGCTMFITTHSNVVLDLFSGDDGVQILHVTHDGKTASVEAAPTFAAKCSILEDLGSRASDMLQANCLVWVEGPSDRIYIRHWMDRWTESELREGTHYRVMPYAGDMVDYFTCDDPDANPDDLIAMVGFNPHPIFVCDRDKTEKGPQKEHIDKIKSDVVDRGGVAWITDGKEIENYIPSEALKKLWGKDKLPPLGKDDDFEEYVKTHTEKGMGSKPIFACRVCRKTTREMLQKDEHLSKWLTEICDKIRGWNGMPIVADDVNGLS